MHFYPLFWGAVSAREKLIKQARHTKFKEENKLKKTNE